MKRLLNPVFLVLLGIYLSNQLLQKAFGIFIPYIHAYLGDVLCLPIMLTFSVVAFIKIKGLGEDYRLPWRYTVFTLAYVALVFELALPGISNRFYSDPLDVVAYAFGAVFFHLVLNRPIIPRYNSPSSAKL